MGLKAAGYHGNAGHYPGTGRRRLTVAECAVLQGFPADHPFKGTKASQYMQVGNAVPPALAEAIARAIPSPPEE